jgi:hypothetical protein
MMGMWPFVVIRKDVLPLGSKQSLSNGKEPEELTDLIAAFETQNTCKIILTVSLEQHKGYLDSRWTAAAAVPCPAGTVPEYLDCVSVSVWGGDYKTLMAVVSRLLYALDFQLALNEFDGVKTQKA